MAVNDPYAQQPPKDQRFGQIGNIVLNNEDFLVAVDGDNYDAIAAATGLGLTLQSMGKKVTYFSTKPIDPQQFISLTGSNYFTNEISSNSNQMMIDINCPVDSIDKVDSDPGQTNRLSLMINFKKDAVVPPTSAVTVRRAGSSFSAGFLIGCESLDNDAMVQKGDWVYISRKGNKLFAKVNFVEPQGTLSETMTSILSQNAFKIPADAIYNLYLGIKFGTNNFEMADSIAMETAAFCLRMREALMKQGQPQPVGFGQQPSPGYGYPPQTAGAAPVGEAQLPQTPIEAVEAKEAAPSAWQKPPVFTGATTPSKA